MNKETLQSIKRAAQVGFYDTKIALEAEPYLAKPHRLALGVLKLINIGITDPKDMAKRLDCSSATVIEVDRLLRSILPLERLSIAPLDSPVPDTASATPLDKMLISEVRNFTPPFHSSLTELLVTAYRCHNFDGVCTEMVWSPTTGHIPRGCCGAIGELNEVQLVIILEEPGNPHQGEESYSLSTPHEICEAAMLYAYKCYESRRGRVHDRIRRYLLDEIWPNVDFDRQMRKVWITESMLCSKPQVSWNRRGPRRKCVETYLQKQLSLFPNAVVAVFGKAIWEYIPDDGRMIYAVSISTRINIEEARRDWLKVVEAVRHLTYNS